MSDTSSLIAHLIPQNSEARRAYNDVVLKLKENSDNSDNFDNSQLQHASRFMLITPHNADDKNCNIIEEEPSEETATEVESDSENISTDLIWGGYYVLRFDVLTNSPAFGWIIGTGRWDAKWELENGGVDLQIAKPRTPYSKYGVAGKHARLFFDKTGSLVISGVSPRASIVLGNEGFTNGQRIITHRQSSLLFGNLRYSLDFVVRDEDEYQKSLKAFFRDHLGRAAPPPDLSATPSPWDTILGDWLIRGTVGQGAFATVSAAKHTSSGVAGAAKVMTRNHRNLRLINDEILQLKSLPDHSQLLKFCEVLYERGHRWFTSVDDESDERYGFPTRPEKVAIIFQPFARSTLAESLPKIPIPMRLVAFWQILQGMLALHNAGLIHRDLKLDNIGVIDYPEQGVLDSSEQINTVILDYGQTVCQRECDPIPRRIGTIPYLAPEMELKKYGNGVDIWALGVVGYQMFITEGKLRWNHVVKDKKSFDPEFALLQKKSSSTIENLLSRMLAWDPAERISAQSALSHAAFSNLTQDHDVIPQPGQKRTRDQVKDD